MFLVNLTWLQLFAVFGGLSAGVVALYLWDRSKRRLVVPALRFWQPAERAAEVKHRKRIQQPLSLLLQLISIALLLLALAQPRWGAPGPVSRNHVLVLDTSAWMAARSGAGTLMDQACAAARAYVRSLPAGDRLMLVRADALPAPATAFEHNRAALEQAIAESYPGSTALNLGQALEFACQAQKLQGGPRGEIAYAGAGHTADAPPEAGPALTPNIRVLAVPDAAAGCGLRRISVRRSASDPGIWEILASVHNYGTAPQTAVLALSFSGSPAGSRRLALAPLADQNVAFQYRARIAGALEARLLTNAAFPGDDQAELELPAQKLLNVIVYSDDPKPLGPVLTADPQVNAVFRKSSEYAPGIAADVVILDRFNPSVRPGADSIWIEPPPDGAPVLVQSTVSNAELTSWRSDHPLAAGLRAKDMRLESAEVFAPAPGDVAVARIEAGPVIVAHPLAPKFVVLGFHPVRGALRYELTTPLLFANILRWMAPDIFRRWELIAGSPGTISVALGPEAASAGIHVIAENGTELPYALDGGNLRFFAGTPGAVRVIAGDREMVFSLTLPELAGAKWTPPAGAMRGVPPAAAVPRAFSELWPWFALAGALGLVVEWILFGRGHVARIHGHFGFLRPLRRSAP